jgi:hypothetical protein
LALPGGTRSRWEPVVVAAADALALLGPVPDAAQVSLAERVAKLRELFGPDIETAPLFPALSDALAIVARLGDADEATYGLEEAMADVAQYVLGPLDWSIPAPIESSLNWSRWWPARCRSNRPTALTRWPNTTCGAVGTVPSSAGITGTDRAR